MKKLLFMTMALAIIVASVDAKEKTIKYGKYLIYQGTVEGNEPNGEGLLQVTSKNNPAPTILLKGLFQNMVVNNAELDFPGGYSFKGNLSYLVSKKPALLTIKLDEGGAFYDKDKKLIGLVDEEGFSIAVSPEDETHISAEGLLAESAPIASIKDYIRYAQDDSYKVEYSVIPLDLPANSDPSLKEDCHTALPLVINDNGWDYSPTKSAPAFTVSFSNGTVIRADGNDRELWEKPSGDYISFDFDGNGVIWDYQITLGNTCLKNGIIHHRFENGNVYEGTFNKDNLGISLNYNGLKELLKADKVQWEWLDFFSGITSDGGTVVFNDGSRYEGSFIVPEENIRIKDGALPEKFYNTGKLYNPDGMIVHTYVDGKNEIQLAEEKRKADEEKERRRLAYEESLKTDFVDFNEDHPDHIRAFKKTLSDMSVIEGTIKKDYGSYFDTLKITYPDGTIFTTQRGFSSDASKFKSTILPMKFAPLFSDIRIIKEATFSNDTMAHYILGTSDCVKWLFPDGMSIESKDGYNASEYLSTLNIEHDYTGFNYEINIQTPTNENGDFAVFRVINYPRQGIMGTQEFIKSFFKTFPDCSVMAEHFDYVRYKNDHYPDYVYSEVPDFYQKDKYQRWTGKEQACKGTISYNNGGMYKGVFSVLFSDNHNFAFNNDPRIKVLGARIIASLENMSIGTKIDGKEYDADGQLIAIYKDGRPLDAFDVAQTLAQEKADKAREEAKLKKEKERLAQYEKDCQKYGEKYVDAWEFSHRILVGTPEEYFLNNVGKVELYYESNYTRSYHVRTLGGDIGLSIDVDKSTKKITHVYDHRR